MLVEKKVFDELCPSYQKIIKTFEEEYAAATDISEKYNLFIEFRSNYLMIPELWKEYFELRLSGPNVPSSIRSKVMDEQLKGYKNVAFHFYDKEDSWFPYNTIFPKLLRRNSPKYIFFFSQCLTKKEIEAELKCPSNILEETLRFCDYYSCSSISKKCIQNYRELKSMFVKIVEAENDWKKWFELITQIENFEYVCQNIDHRLGKDLNNVELWKLYFAYLEGKSSEKLLQLYSRYCRYFLDDKEMKIEYEKAAKKYGPIIVHWKNAFEFEEFQEEPQFPSPSAHIPYSDFHSPAEKFPINKEYHRQIFSLPKTNMVYIMDTVKPAILHKLHQTCKYFFAAIPHPVCHGIWNGVIGCTRSEIWFREQSLGILECMPGSKSKICFDQKIILSNSFVSEYASKSIFSQFISSNILECHIKFLRLHDQDISAKDYGILVKSGNIEKLMLHGVNIGVDNGTPFTLEMILEPLPKIIEFEIDHPIITPNTFERLLKLNFVNKFQVVHLRSFQFIEPSGFCEFVKKNFIFETNFEGSYSWEVVEANPEMVQTAQNVVIKELGHIYEINKYGNASRFIFGR